MPKSWLAPLIRWTEAGLIDAETAARITAFESERDTSSGFGWPIRIALAFGALMLAAGVLLFVSAHWDALSPAARFALVILLVAVFHVAAGAVANRFPGMATTLHAVGTVALGAGVFLAGQIFNLDEHWPGGVMLWALGAALAWALLRDVPQMTFVAVLVPAWLMSEWMVAVERLSDDAAASSIPACGAFLLALTYFTAVGKERAERGRRALVWVGGVLLIPAAIGLAATAVAAASPRYATALLPGSLRALGWTVALGLPLMVAGATRRAAAWPVAVAGFWTLVFVELRPAADQLFPYLWWAAGATALAGWGVADARSERINMGSAMFALTVLTFYFSKVMDKLGRSASLVVFGVLFLAGGWALERLRRRLVLRARGSQA